ncbi:MAG: LysR family transcriptional regulator [Marinicaulis sp.]|nr:LysR family transcriptional regulator [Marinicaulis sp.]
MSEKRLEGLDLNLLLALHWLLAERNVTAAANRLGLSQPAASRALSRLRDIFEDPLLVKSGAVMTPTPFAESMQPALAHAIERCRDVLRLTEKFDPSTEQGSFRIACVDYTGALVASAWLNSVAKEAPGIDLDIVSLTISAARDLVSGKIDLVIMPEVRVLDLPPTLDIDQFVSKPVMATRYKTAIRKGHPLSGQNLTMKRFCDYDHILVTPDGAKTGIVDMELAKLEMSRRIAFRTSTFLLALSILQKTDCLLTAPEGLLALDENNIEVFEPPLPVPGFQMYASWHPNWTHDERHRWVREKLYHGCDMVAAIDRVAAA